MKKLNITFCSFPDFTGNARALYEYMIKRYGNNMNYTWIVHEEKNFDKVKKHNENAILMGTHEFENYISKTNVFFTTHADLTGDKNKCKNAIYIELWHGVGPKPGGFMANGILDEDRIWYNKINKIIDYLIVPSEFWRPLFSSSFGLEYERVMPLGYPKLNLYLTSGSKDKISKLIGEDAKKYSKIIFYMPTFRKGCGRKSSLKYSDNIINLCNYEEKNLTDYLKKNNYLLLIKLHPSEETKKILATDCKNVKLISQKSMEEYNYDINEILSGGDVLITDYSSLGVEFLFLNKPVIYLSTDMKKYSESRGLIYENYDFWSSNTSISTLDELINKLNYYLSTSYKFDDYFYEKKKLWFDSLKNGGCDKICDFVFDEYSVSKKLVRNKCEVSILKNEIRKRENIINEQIGTIKKLTESDIRLKEIENSKGWKLLEKIRKTKRRYFK